MRERDEGEGGRQRLHRIRLLEKIKTREKGIEGEKEKGEREMGVV